MQLSKTQIDKILQGAPAGANQTKILDTFITAGYEIEGVDTQKALDSIKQRESSGMKSMSSATNTLQQPVEEKKPLGQRIMSGIKDFAGDVKGVFTDTVASTTKRAENITDLGDKMRTGERGGLETRLKQTGQVLGAGADAIGNVFEGGIKALASQDRETEIKGLLGELGQEVSQIKEVGQLNEWYNNLDERKKEAVDSAGGALSLISEFIGAGVAKRSAQSTVQAVKPVLRGAVNAAEDVAIGIADTSLSVTNAVKPMARGGEQLVSDFGDRIKRATQRTGDFMKESAQKSDRIAKSTPAVQEAIKSNLDDRIINTVTQSDDVTRKALRDVIEIAEDATTTVGAKKQPTIVGGNLAAEQFDLINKQKKNVGKQIGDLTKTLSKTQTIDMRDAYGITDEVLSSQGIIPTYTKKGTKLDFTGSKYTPAERTKIQELYKLATEGGETLSPLQIREKDQLFSKLKRESNFEGVGDLLIETEDGTKSLFNVFRDIYSNKLDTISPEIKELNSQYRKLATITDDIEDSIFKTPNFNVTKTADPAEFAKVNMRRIFGEAQSSPVYEAIADQMDTVSRSLGYAGATPKDIAEFAQYIRKLYPETVPKTGFTGSIQGISDIASKIISVGAPDIKDQQKALRMLLEEMTQ